MTRTRNETLGGSPTAGRLAADQAINGGELATQAVDAGSQLLTGGGLPLGTLLRGTMNVAGDAMKLGVGKAAQERALKMAQVLLNTSDPKGMANMVDGLITKQGDIAKRLDSYRKIAGLLGGTAAVSHLGP